MKIGGGAECIIKLKDLSELKETLPKPIRILGNGSNILIDDRGLKGSVVVVRDFPPEEPTILDEGEDLVTLQVSAGFYLPTMARWCERKGLAGCEFMIGVPGTIGGALVQNAGANEQEIKDSLVRAEVFNLTTRQTEIWSKEKCGLTYRNSILRNSPDLLVTSVVLQLARRATSAIAARIENNLVYRREKTPFNKPSLGSIFTRVPVGERWLYPGQLIEASGLKGYSIGGAQVSPVHANYIVNEDAASFEDVVNLIEHIEKVVFKTQGLKLTREILVWTDRH